MLQSRFVTLFFIYTVLGSSLISSILLLTDTEIISHANGQELNSTNDGTVNINELISKLESNITKLENNITKLEEHYTDLQNLNESLTTRLGVLEQSLSQDIPELYQRIDCVAYATENNLLISEECPPPPQ